MLRRKARSCTRHLATAARISPSPPSSDLDLGRELDSLDQQGNADKQDQSTYISSLLRRCHHVWQTKRIHRYILASPRLSSDRLLLNLLVQSYGHIGRAEEARQVFETIPQRNVFSWTMIMAAYAQNGHSTQALEMFHRMLLDGSRPDEVGFLTALECCSSSSTVSSSSSPSSPELRSCLRAARMIHELIRAAGLESVTFLGNALANLYGRSGCLDEAEDVFDSIEQKDVVSWNTMLTLLARAGEGDRALELFREMIRQRVKPDRVTYINLLEASTSCCTASLDRGREIHAMIVEDGLESDIVLGNTLVSAYADCGAVDEAREVFESMEQRDVVSWNAIIRAYSQHGHRKSALEMFRRMQHECSVAPNDVTFVTVLGAAEDAGELTMIHDRVAENGFNSSNVFVGNSLVHLHGKCGSVDDARRLFDSMPMPSVSSWNSIVDAYAHNGLGREAMKLFRGMQHEGLRPDKVTFLTALEACATLSEVKFLRDLVALAGLQSDVLLETTLLQVFARNSSIADAKRTFEGIRGKDLFAWNTLLTAYAQCGADEEALQTFHGINQEGLKPGEQTFVSVLDSCASMADLARGVRAHESAVECGVEGSVSVGNTLITMYARCGRIEQAESVFSRMQEKNTVSWNALASAYVQHSRGDQALQLLARMQLEGTKPDKVTFFASLDACFTDPSHVRMIHRQIASAGHLQEVSVGNCLMNAYRRCQSLEECRSVFEAIDGIRDVVSWTSMLCACVEDGSHREEAFEIWYRMQQHGAKPDSVTFSGILDACSSSESSSNRHWKMILEQAASSGHSSSPAVLPALVGLYSQCSSLARAAQAFEAAESRDVLLYNSMISAYTKHGRGKSAIALFKKMDVDGISFNRGTVNAVFDACAVNAGLAQARTVHSTVAETGFVSDVIIDNTLINMYGKCGSPIEARRVFDSMRERALVSWNSIVTVAAQHGQVDEARKLFRRMQQEGLKPDNVALMSVASVCQHVGLLEEAFYYLFQLANEYRVAPKRERYSCIVGLLGRLGWLEEAESIIRRMPFKPNETVWKNLLMSCKIHNDVARGARVADELLELDSADSATYVTLYNMYAEQVKESESTKSFDELAEMDL